MAPEFARFEQENGSRLHIVKVNCDNHELVAQYAKYKGSNYIPETVILKSGRVVFRKVGRMTAGTLVMAVKAVR